MTTSVTIGTALQNRLTAFSQLDPIKTAGGTSSVAYQGILTAIQNSSALAKELNTAANTGTFAAFGVLASTAHAGAQFDPSNGGTLLFKISAIGTSALSEADLVFQMGHETQHALNAATIAEQTLDFTKAVFTLSKSSDIQDYTSIIQTRMNGEMNNEVTAQISGWNAYVGFVNNTTPAGVTPNYTTSYLSKYFVTPDGKPLPGITFSTNPDGTNNYLVDPTNPTNIQGERNAYIYNVPAVLGPTGMENYSNFYAADSIAYITNKVGSNNITLNLTALNLDPAQLQQGLNGEYSSATTHSTAPITLTDSSTNTVYRFNPGTTGTLETSSSYTNTNGTGISDTLYDRSGNRVTTDSYTNTTDGTLTTTTVNYNTVLPGGLCTFNTNVTQIGFPGISLNDIDGIETIAGLITSANVSGIGATINANGANITFANAAIASVVGSGNTMTGGNDVSLTTLGTNQNVSLGAGSTLNVSTGFATVNLDNNGSVMVNAGSKITTSADGRLGTVTDGSGQLLTTMSYNPNTSTNTKTDYINPGDLNIQNITIYDSSGGITGIKTVIPYVDNNPGSATNGQVIPNTYAITTTDSSGTITGTGQRTFNPADGTYTDAILGSITPQNPQGTLTVQSYGADGLPTSTPVNNLNLAGLGNAAATFNDAYAVINAIKNHQPVPALTSGVQLYNDLSKGVSPGLLGSAQGLGAAASLYGFEQALNHGDVSGAVVAGTNAFVQGANALTSLGYGTVEEAGLTTVVGDATGVLPYLNLANDLIHGNTAGAVGDAVGIYVASYAEAGGASGPAGAAIGAVVGLVVGLVTGELLDNSSPPSGIGFIQWGSANGQIQVVSSGNAGGDTLVYNVLTQMIGNLNGLTAGYNAKAPASLQIGLIPERMGSINYWSNSVSNNLHVNTVDPTTGQALNPNLYFGTDGSVNRNSTYDGKPGYFQNLTQYYATNALARQALAPEWEVQTAQMQANSHLTDAGLTETERAADQGHLAAPITAGTTTETWNPIALDFGGGLATTALASSAVKFDVDGIDDLDANVVHVGQTHYLHQTGWLNKTDGFLVLDENINGTIDDGQEMFSNSQVAGNYRGIASLAVYDGNGDGVINATDPVFAQLGVWIDTQGKGQLTSSNYHSLSSLDIVSLNYRLGTYTKADGSLHQMGTLSLQADTLGTSYTPVPDGIQLNLTNGQTTLEVTQLHNLSSLQANEVGFTTNEDVAAVIQVRGNGSTIQGLLDTDSVSNAPNAVLQVSGVANAQGGTVAYDPTAGTVTFTPTTGFSGTAGFDYTVDAGVYGQATAHVQVTVAPVNHAPVITNQIQQIPIYGYQETPDPGSSTDNPLRPDITPMYKPGIGAADANDDGPVIYRDTPVAYQANPDAGTLSATDQDYPASALTWSIVNTPQYGTATLDKNGNWTYTTDPNRFGVTGNDAFVVQVTDPSGAYAQYTVSAPPTPKPDLGGSDFGGGGGSSDGGDPLILDLNGSGFHFTSVNDSNVFFQQANDGLRHQTAWFNGGNGVLAFDKFGDGIVHDSSQIDFESYLPGATSSLQGLAAFDSNHDGVINSQDALWSKLGVWVDSNNDGLSDAGEFHSLASLGITSISLSSTNQFSVNNGVVTNTVATFTYANGTTGQMADVTLPFSNNVLAPDGNGGTRVTQVAPANPSAPIVVGDGNNIVLGNVGDNTIQAGNGNDTIMTGSGNDMITAGNGNNSIMTGDGKDLVIVGNGNNTVILAAGPKEVFTGGGNNTIVGGSGNNIIMAGQGNNTLYAGSGNSVVSAQNGANTLVGGVGYNELIAGNGNNNFTDGGGRADMNAGTGSNIFSVTNVLDTITVTAPVAGAVPGVNTVKSSVNWTLGANQQILWGTGTAALTLTGNDAGDQLIGNGAADTLIGGAGNDILADSGGAATLIGGGGNDTYIVSNVGTKIIKATNGGNDTVKTSVNYTLPQNVKTLIGTGNAVLTLTGGSQDGVTIRANNANDTLVAGSGIATLVGGSGNDTFVVNNANDVVQAQAAGNANTILTSVSYTAAANVQNLVGAGGADITLTGNFLADTIRANAGNDTLIAVGSNTTLIGGAGNDSFIVGDGASQITTGSGINAIHVGTGNDTIVNQGGTDSLYFSPGVTADDLTFSQSGNDLLINEGIIGGTVRVVGGYNNLTAGISRFIAGDGNYQVNLDNASYNFAAGNGNDQVTTGNGNNTIALGNGNDAISVGNGKNSLTVGNGTNQITTGTGINAIHIGMGNNTVVNQGGTDSLYFSPSITWTDLNLTQSGNDELVQTYTGQGGTTRIVNGTNPTDGISQYVAGDGVFEVNLDDANYNFVVGNGDDYFWGGNGNDIVKAGNGANSITLGNGNDQIVVGDGDGSSVSAGSGNDSIIAGSGGNQLYLNSLAGTHSSIVTGDGNNHIGVGDGVVQIAAGNGRNFIEIDNGDDTVTVGEGNNTLEAENGNNHVTAGNGNNSVAFGNGNAQVVLGNGNNQIQVGNGINSLTVGDGANQITTGAGVNAIHVGIGNNTVTNKGGTDSLYFAPFVTADDLTFSQSGNDLLIAEGMTGGSVRVVGGYSNLSDAIGKFTAGDGKYTVTLDNGTYNFAAGNGDDKITAGNGNDTIALGNGSDQVTVGNGNNQITTGSGVNAIHIGTGNDTIVNQGGIDTLYFAPGVTADSLVFSQSGNDLLIKEGTTGGSVRIVGGYGNPSAAIQQFIAGNGNYTVQLDNGNYNFVAGNGNNSITAGNGNDQITTGSGVNAIHLGTGHDTIVNHGGTDSLYFSPTVTADSLTFSQSGNDLLVTEGTTGGSVRIVGGYNNLSAAISQFIAGNGNYTVNLDNGNYNFAVGDGHNTINLGNGTDQITTGSGSNAIHIGAGNDTIVNQDGIDTLYFAPNVTSDSLIFSKSGNDDLVTESATGGSVRIADGYTNPSAGIWGAAGIYQFVGGNGNYTVQLDNGEDTRLQLGTGNNSIRAGDTGFNQIYLGDQAGAVETVVTGNSSNNIYGGDGNDQIVAGNGSTAVVLGNGNDQVNLGNATSQVTLGNGKNSVNVGNGNDRITVGEGDNLIVAGNGQDTVTAGYGNNHITLGSGAVDSVTLQQGNNTVSLGGGLGDQVYTHGGTNAITLNGGQYNLTNTGSQDNVTLAVGSNDHLWFQQKMGNKGVYDLWINVLGSNEQLIVNNWTKGNISQLTSSNGLGISGDNIAQLVQAMSSFTPPTAGQTSYTADEQQKLAPLMASNWH